MLRIFRVSGLFIIMKIAIDISQIVYPSTGVATFTMELVKQILQKDKDNQYLLFGMALSQMDRLNDFYNICKRINNNVVKKFIPLPEKLSNFLFNKIRYPDLFKFTNQVDIYHSSDWIQLPADCRKITTIHDLVIKKYPELSDPYIVNTHEKRLQWVKKECDLVVADSISTKKDIIKYISIHENKIEVVYPGINDIFIPCDHQEISRVKNRYGLLDDYILSVGTIEPRKNLKRTVEAFGQFMHHQLISSLGKPVELIIIGKTGWGNDIKPIKGTRILGMVESIDLPAIYSGAKMFVYPSLYEGFGLPVIEAFSCGCPVITSDRGSLEEISGGASQLVDPDNSEDIAVKMVKVFIDKSLRNDLISKGIKQANNFSWEKTADGYISSYQKIFKQ